MNTNPENLTDESESNMQSGMTRRTFIKRTSGTALIIVLALSAFREELLAAGEASGSDDSILEFDVTAGPNLTGSYKGADEVNADLEKNEKAGRIINRKTNSPIKRPNQDKSPPKKLQAPAGYSGSVGLNLKWNIVLPPGHYQFQIKGPK